MMKWPSVKVRDTFIQYFLRHNKFPHTFVQSSSVVPRNDPSLAFVNAGMNQFKDVILGYGRPAHSRVTNSQKCLRINDLKLVGADTYHHTFFEMLGNWSFSNYFKKEACEMAWDLLTNIYKLDPNRLYVTYFAGSDSLPMDMETKEIWESIGVSSDRILPFGNENFWAMGPIGPCGPSTEIHYNHRDGIKDPLEVNKDSGIVVEIWNLVFMQYNRQENGKLKRLPLSHVVDTGAGLERLTAVLNEKVSNYDTDLFTPIFQSVQQFADVAEYCGSFSSQLDCDYRVFADHMRAVTVALSDGVLPQTNYKVRKLVHRVLNITEKKFLPNVSSALEIVDFLNEIVNSVSSTLSHVYPEIEKMKAESSQILALEVHRYLEFGRLKNISSSEILPRLLTMDFPPLARIKKAEIDEVKNAGVVDGKMAFKWYDSHGVTEEMTEELANTLGLKFDREGLKSESEKLKKIFRDDIAKQMIFNDEKLFVRKVESLLSLYKPDCSGGVCLPIDEISEKNPVYVEWIFDVHGDLVEEISLADDLYWLILNRTSLIPGSYNYESDMGTIKLENDCKLSVTKVELLPSGWILHLVKNVPEIGVSRKSKVINISVDNEKRFGRRMSAVALHHLKKWLQDKYSVVRFGEEFMTGKSLTLEVTILHGEITSEDVKECQDCLNKYGAPIVVTARTGKRNGVYDLTCSTGLAAEASMRGGCEVVNKLLELKDLCQASEKDYAACRETLKLLVQNIGESIKNKNLPLPFEVYLKADEILEGAEKVISKNEILHELKIISEELAKVTDTYVLKSFPSDQEFTSLKKITRLAENKPVLVIVYSSDDFVQGRCTIPKELVSDEFSAEEWMKSLVSELGRGVVGPPKGQDPKLVANLKRVKILDRELHLRKGMEKAREYITKVVRHVSSDHELRSR